MKKSLNLTLLATIIFFLTACQSANKLQSYDAGSLTNKFLDEKFKGYKEINVILVKKRTSYCNIFLAQKTSI